MSKDFEKATLKKASVNTLPLWVDRDLTLSKLKNLPEEDSLELPLQESSFLSSSSNLQLSTLPTFSAPSAHSHSAGTSLANGAASTLSLNDSNRYPSSSIAGSGSPSAPFKNGSGTKNSSQPEWSIFATMSVPTMSSAQQRQYQSLNSSVNTITSPPTSPTVPSKAAQTYSSLKRFPQKLDQLFQPKSTSANPSNDSIINNDISTSTSICTCTCPQHQPSRTSTGGRLGVSMSKRRNRKESMEASRGYPRGQCISADPPTETNWDEKEVEELLPEKQQQGFFFANNTAFNLKALKNFLNSPLFSNLLKSLTIMASVSLFAIALDAIVILLKTPEQQTQLSNDNAALVVTVILSILTILYSCFTIFLESRRPPEGLDASNSKPLIVIFSEIVASIVWAQVLSVTIYIYIWTYGCTEAGQRELERSWKLEVADRQLTGRLCRRQGAMVGLELLLVLLLIFNFYTHLEINFRFARSMR
ncbi:hypothetical protein BG006_001568 [Podila minutissima]|uniref:Uncharacterized protein n=1 Tax=Podila minutissima TaxID=64525 RepID=A0A9P5VP09_9FUNG|nr:hypothetical protein BG006_001568 [Podila minutissima]